MLFNSVDFALFLPIVFILYWFVFNKNINLQNFLIVVASYFFYGWWDWKFLGLIAFSTFVDYSIGVALSKENRPLIRKILLWTSISVNLGFLGFFKYYNFFLDNFVSAYSFFGQEINVQSLNIILPVGISFYTFQTLSYTIDVYRKQLEPTRDFIAFSAFVCFFPQLVAGPIERATHLLPQFYKKRVFDYSKAVDGMRQILWGLFKKIVIADNCAEYANEIFNNSGEYSGSTLLLGAFFFTFQIYGDFSGYSDIAIGTSRLFGFDLMKNFAFPYFSRDIAEFWRRWHISLSTWFRDYLYIPLGGSRGGTWMKIRNTFIIFLVSGFWHGANWTFLVWGALNAIYFLPLMLSGKNRQNIDIVAQGKYLPNFKEILQIIYTFLLTVLAWVFFRAENVAHALSYLANIFDTTLFSQPQILPTTLIALLALFIITEWLQREKNHGLEIYGNGLLKHRPIRWGAYIGIIIIIFSFGGSQQEFIYFQF
ncbi:MBOAT family O-acyltransferase [Zobellia galactanivorans]|uniref:Poly(Beta-D-mannuronate) O-acetylase n=1 Tax=Zobellia galactanivorans (strain DSM 12802 / CCUG 47099 / CIP 106680 / NCIMB 13871 / Dsij) TaxID=63186 RepID=G0L1U9_ZOBGA|nr:MBOAT family O-acyltransferase [Zobellia galactanivorans]CAZ97915.1 Poly(beta-D-mannuronate) O-acetylase [Zobellia galactanivorans]